MRADSIIFVVDDDAAVRESLSWLLGSGGLHVEAFPSGEAFLQAADRQRVGCVVLDVRMPGMSGLEVQREMAVRGWGMPIIFISGHADVPLVVEAMKRGAFDFLEKPFAEQHLLESVGQALASRRRRRG